MNNKKHDLGIKEVLDSASKDANFRIELTKKSFYWFLHIYFPDYLEYGLASFHKEIVETLEDDNLKNYVLAAFRGSGKSTIVSLAFLLWEILGCHNKKFIVFISNTIRQSETHFQSIKEALEKNELLRTDMGPFKENSGQWNTTSLVFTKYKAKLMASSLNESIRGVKYLKHRPQVIVCDDVETLEITRSVEGKEKLIEWFNRDIKPLGTEQTKIIVVGTFLSDGSLMETLRLNIEDNVLTGIFKKYPIIEDERILWPERWKNLEEINEFRKIRGLNEQEWQTEYLLNSWVSDFKVVRSDMIHYYDILPTRSTLRQTYVSVDLAVSQKQSDDFTAIVSCEEHYIDNECYLYVLPQIINRKMPYPETRSQIISINSTLSALNKSPTVIMESNGTLKGFALDLKHEVRRLQEFTPGSQDKESRLWEVTPYFEDKRILFPQIGAEQLINQLLNFKIIKQHDDLIDALVMCLLISKSNKRNRVRVFAHKPAGF